MNKCVWQLLILLALLGPSSAAQALVVRVAGSGPEEIPELFYHVGDPALEIVLEIANDSDTDSPPVGLWQLALAWQGLESATGSVNFQTLTPPFDSMFGDMPGPVALGDLPATVLVASDVDTSAEFDGVVIPAYSTVPIVALIVQPTPNATGAFNLWGTAFDAESPDVFSYWTDVIDFQPIPFENPIDNWQGFLLAEIQMTSAPGANGDFNQDRVVDAADYTIWRDGLGGEFTAEDYVVWKSHFGASLVASSTSALTPEAPSIVLFGWAFLTLCVPPVVRECRRARPLLIDGGHVGCPPCN